MANSIYPVGGKVTTVTVTPTLTVHDSYVTGDYVGTSTDDIEFGDCVLTKGGGGVIETAILVDYATQGDAMELWLFDTTVVPPADSAAWTITDAELKTCVGVISFPAASYFASGANDVCVVKDIGLWFKCASGSKSLYGCLVTRDSSALASGDITIRLVIHQL